MYMRALTGCVVFVLLRAGIAAAGKLPGKQVCVYFITTFYPLDYHALAMVKPAFQTITMQNNKAIMTSRTMLIDGATHIKPILSCGDSQVPPLTRVGEVHFIGHGEGVQQLLQPPDLIYVFAVIEIILSLIFEQSVKTGPTVPVDCHSAVVVALLVHFFVAHLELIPGLLPYRLCGHQPNLLSVLTSSGFRYVYCAFTVILFCSVLSTNCKGSPEVARPISVFLSAIHLAWIKFSLYFVFIILSIPKTRQAISRSDKKISKIVQTFWLFRFRELALLFPSMNLSAVLAVISSLVWPTVLAETKLCLYEDIKEAWGLIAGWLKVNHFVSRAVTEKEVYNLLSQLVCGTNRLVNSTKTAVLENTDVLVNTVRIDLEDSLETVWITLICLQFVVLTFTTILIVICKRSACCGRMNADGAGPHRPGDRPAAAPQPRALPQPQGGGGLLGLRPGAAVPADGAAGPAPGGGQAAASNIVDPSRLTIRGPRSPFPADTFQPNAAQPQACVLDLQAPLWSEATTSVSPKMTGKQATNSAKVSGEENPETAEQPFGSAVSSAELEKTVWVFNPELARYIDTLPMAVTPQVTVVEVEVEPPPCLTDSDLTDSSSGSDISSDSDSDTDVVMPDKPVVQVNSNLAVKPPQHELCAMALQAKAYQRIMSSSGLPICPSSLRVGRSRSSSRSRSPSRSPSPAGSSVMGPTSNREPCSRSEARGNSGKLFGDWPPLPAVKEDDKASVGTSSVQDAGYHSLSDTEKVRRGGWTAKARPMAICSNPEVAARLKRAQLGRVTRRNAQGELLWNEPKQSYTWVTTDSGKRFSDVVLNTSAGKVDASTYDAALLMVENERKE